MTTNTFAEGWRASAVLGMNHAFSFFLSVALFGALFGATAKAAGLTELQTVVMSALVMAGSVQFPSLTLFDDPMPYLALVVSAALIASRLTLMGLTLEPQLRHVKKRKLVPVVPFLADPAWVLMSNKDLNADRYPYFVAISLTLYLAWVTGTWAGFHLADYLDVTTRDALHISGAVFIAILVAIIAKSNKTPLAALFVTTVAAVLLDPVLPKAASLPLATLLGALVGTYLLFRKDQSAP